MKLLGYIINAVVMTHTQYCERLRKSSKHELIRYGGLPRFTLNGEGHMAEPDYYYQFLEEGEETIVLFDFEPVDPLLTEEISNGEDIIRIMKDVDLRKFFENVVNPVEVEKAWKHIPLLTYLVFEYSAGHDSTPDGEDAWSQLDFVGYLDS